MQYVCEDCCSIFKLYTPLRRVGKGVNKPPYCPNCADNNSVREYTKADKSNETYHYVGWKGKETDQLIRWMKEGIMIQEIALRLGRSYSSTKNKIRDLRMKGEL